MICKYQFCTCLMIVLYGLIGPAYGSPSLSVLGPDASGHIVTYDDATGNYWYWNLSQFTSKTYWEQINSINSLNTMPYYGLIDWHMASRSEMEGLWNYSLAEIKTSFNPSGTHPQGGLYWCGRYKEGGYLTHSVAFVWGTTKSTLGSWTTDNSGTANFLSAWAVSSGQPPGVIPAPGALILGSIGIGFVGWLRRRRTL